MLSIVYDVVELIALYVVLDCGRHRVLASILQVKVGAVKKGFGFSGVRAGLRRNGSSGDSETLR